MILKSELSAKNKITAIGALVVPVLRYSFGIINWRSEEIKQIDRKSRKILTMYNMHNPKADIDRLHVKRKEGGRGLVQIEMAHKAEIINTAKYLKANYKEDHCVNIVKSHESYQTNMNSTASSRKGRRTVPSQSNEDSDAKQEGIQHTKPRMVFSYQPLSTFFSFRLLL